MEGSIVMKKSLVELDANGLGDYLKLPIHDEVMFNVPEEDVEEVRREAVKIMETKDLLIPLTCDSNVVNRWGDEYREEDREVEHDD